ncbi:MAG: TorF family putative porin [Atribacterota bacterium]|jgi:uncharacterized protein (TIGR02001 family)|nr:TorF family putative porin [Atribacterota bacterium]
MKKNILSLLAVATALNMPLISTAVQADTFTGNINAASKYILRGITNSPEDDNAALQGGFDYALDNGLYVGYWGSSLGYSDPGKSNGFENDFYGGYNGSIGDFHYGVGVVQYAYVNISNSNGIEGYGSVGYGPVTFGAKTLLKDVVWGNKGDTFWTLDYSAALPKDFKFGTTIGYYTYKNSGTYIASTPEKNAFRYADINLSHPIGKTGANVSMHYIIGGKDRNGTKQKNAIFFNLGYNFDI